MNTDELPDCPQIPVGFDPYEQEKGKWLTADQLAKWEERLRWADEAERRAGNFFRANQALSYENKQLRQANNALRAALTASGIAKPIKRIARRA